MSTQHPYKHLEKTPLWKVVRRAVREMNKNGDLELQTAEEYVVGYLVQEVAAAGFEHVSELHVGEKILRVVEVKDVPKKKIA